MGGGHPAALEGLEESRGDGRLEGHELAGRQGGNSEARERHRPQSHPQPLVSMAICLLASSCSVAPRPHPTNAPLLFAALAPSPSVFWLLL